MYEKLMYKSAPSAYESRFTAFAWALFWIGGIAAGCLILFAIVWPIAYYPAKNGCHSFGEQTNRPTRFTVYQHIGPLPVDWDCLTPIGGGRWIPTDKLREGATYE